MLGAKSHLVTLSERNVRRQAVLRKPLPLRSGLCDTCTATGVLYRRSTSYAYGTGVPVPQPNPDRGLPNSEASWSVVPFAVQRGTLLNSGDEGRCRADDPKRALEKFRF